MSKDEEEGQDKLILTSRKLGEMTVKMKTGPGETYSLWWEKAGGLHWNSSRAQKLRPELMAAEVKYHWTRKERALPCFCKFCALWRHDSWTAENRHIMWILKIKEREERTGKEKSRNIKIIFISGTMSSSIDGMRKLIWQWYTFPMPAWTFLGASLSTGSAVPLSCQDSHPRPLFAGHIWNHASPQCSDPRNSQLALPCSCIAPVWGRNHLIWFWSGF